MITSSEEGGSLIFDFRIKKCLVMRFSNGSPTASVTVILRLGKK
ncbi:MAG: hypothetical protein Q7V20_08525 [Aquabacterium sp.]|nr:hypothetical protein [Aquabacterium sp.]MDO9003480.1 hypothetical protein [Aquabacterium sp.]